MNPITALFNRMCHAGKYKSAVAAGKILPSFPVFAASGQEIKDASPTFLLNPATSMVTLIAPFEGSYIREVLPLKRVKMSIERHVGSNYEQICEVLKGRWCDCYGAPYMKALRDERERIEKTIAFFQKETGMRIHDPLKWEGQQFYFDQASAARRDRDGSNDNIDIAIEGINAARESGGARSFLPLKEDGGDKTTAFYLRTQGKVLFNWIWRN